jgi:hypothetical protein
MHMLTYSSGFAWYRIIWHSCGTHDSRQDELRSNDSRSWLLVIAGQAAFISNSILCQGINLPCTSPGGSRGTAAMVAAAFPGRSHPPISWTPLEQSHAFRRCWLQRAQWAVSLSLRDMIHRFAGWQAREVIFFTIAIYILSLRRVWEVLPTRLAPAINQGSSYIESCP